MPTRRRAGRSSTGSGSIRARRSRSWSGRSFGRTRRSTVEATAPAGAREVAERSILVAITDEARVDALLAVAEPLVRHPPRVLILARLVPDAAELRVRVGLARGAPVGARSARRRRACGLVHVDGAR